MKTTIDSAGRIVIPKSIRSQAGLGAGQAVEITFRHGAILIEPALSEVRLAQVGPWMVAVSESQEESLTTLEVENILEELRARS